MTTPPCFESAEDFEAYTDLLEETVTDAARSYCWDCTPEYKEKMKAQGLCRHPLVQFVMVDGALVGKRPDAETARKQAEAVALVGSRINP